MAARKRPLIFLAIVGILAAAIAIPAGPARAQDSVALKAAKGELPAPVRQTPKGEHLLPTLSAGVVITAREVLNGGAGVGAAAAPADGVPMTLGCSDRNPGGNVRVNQDCTFTTQAEELIKANPLNPRNLIAGQNDSRIGFNRCGFDYSFDGGKTWGDGVPPFYARLNRPPAGHTIIGGPGTNHTYDAGSDPALTFDSQGNAYFSCVVFDVISDANAVLVTMSPNFAGGSYYQTVPSLGSAFVVVEDNSAKAFHDKEFIVADSYPTSRFKDSVYVTWTVFKFDRQACPRTTSGYCSSKIYFAKSTDQARNWSAPVVISGVSPELCVDGDLFDPTEDPHACDFDQGSDPIVRPNGDLVVVFSNANTPGVDNHHLAVISTDGGATWSDPVLVGEDFVTRAPRCNFGTPTNPDIRFCIPGAFVRTNDFPRVAVNRASGNLYVTWSDYRTGEWDIQLARSTDGGRTWEEADLPVHPDTDLDHYFPAIDIVPSMTEDRVAISYLRTDRVPGESDREMFVPGEPGVQTSPSDYALAGGRGLTVPFADRQVAKPFPPTLTGFNGDYTGLVIVEGRAHPIWSDSRNPAPGGRRDLDVFTDDVAIP